MQVKTTLYKQSKSGSVQQWSVFAVGDTITVEWGQVSGKMQTQSTKCFPKNIGKSNETCPEAQAIIEAISKWEKQVKSGYTEDPSGKISVKLPMKVKNYWDNKHNIIFPCDAEYKYNGVNAIYTRESGKLELKSRGGEDYPLIPHHIEEVVNFMDKVGTDTLNVELYYDLYLQDIQSAVKKHNENTDKLDAIVFDIPDHGEISWSERVRKFEIYSTDYYNYLFNPVRKFGIKTHKELEEFHNKAVSDGYEGIIIRNTKGKYEYNRRSSDVFKMKVAQDAEFLITGHYEDKKGHAVFYCETPSGKSFKVKCKGDDNTRASILKDADDWVGEYLKVEYEELSKDGVPLKPVGIWIRKVDENGEALE